MSIVLAGTKRRRNDDIPHTDTRPLIIQDLSAKPKTFTPICLLSRSQLPLAYIDTAQDGGRLFTAHVQDLEACAKFEADTSVLIVEEAQEKRLYAIERVKRLQYAICRLGAWVKTEHVMRGAKTATLEDAPPLKRPTVQPEHEGKPWWTKATVDPEHGIPPAPKPSSLRLSMLACKDATATEPTKQVPTQIEDAPSHVNETPINDLTSKPTPDALEDLAKHYLDSLYLSRTPVAYFVKGPLARVRAAFAPQPAELVAFLRGAVLSAPTTDKKYRETIAELIKDLPILDTPETKPRKQKKRKWKPTRDKSGFFVTEKDFVEQWWRKDEDSQDASLASETIDAAIHRRSQRLRSRETFLQVILILEVLALEASGPPAAGPQATESQVPDDPSATTEKKPRKKKELDVTAMLETLLDRLCIWYSLEGSPAKTNSDGKGNADTASDDLKSFASEVIVPFWTSRIPDVANSTSKKLGGPSAPTPKRRSMTTYRKPGEPAVRQAPEKKPRIPLARVSTDTLNHTGKRPPSLHRSATDSDALAPLIKREMSQTPPIDSIPLARHRARHLANEVPRRGSLIHQLSFGSREVDLSAMSQASEAKMRKKAEVQNKIQDAISVLKKPNRHRAVEEMAKNADESFAKAISRAKPKAGTGKKPLEKSNIAITETPRHIKATPAPRRTAAQPEFIPSSSFAMPQTSLRSVAQPTRAVAETPSRGFRGRTYSPIKRMPAIQASPIRPTTRHDDSGIALDDDDQPEEQSIEDALGWNDDDYELLH